MNKYFNIPILTQTLKRLVAENLNPLIISNNEQTTKRTCLPHTLTVNLVTLMGHRCCHRHHHRSGLKKSNGLRRKLISYEYRIVESFNSLCLGCERAELVIGFINKLV